MDQEKYMQAHALLDKLVGERFTELQAAQSEVPHVEQKIGELKAAFQECFDTWTNLRSMSDDQLQAVIDANATEAKNDLKPEE